MQKNRVKNNRIWEKFLECSCHTEGIMLSYENDLDDGTPVIDLAFFSHGERELSFGNKLRWIWQVLITGKPYLDMVMLDQKTAKELGDDLIAFSQKKYVDGTTVKTIRMEYDAKIKELQERCEHKASTWCENQFAPGHSDGSKSRICDVCEKVLETVNNEEKYFVI